MTHDNQLQLRTRFDALAHPAAGDATAFWYARDLLKVLGDSGHAAFLRHVRHAAKACVTAGKPVALHCRGVMRTPADRKDDGRPERDFELSRHACLLVATNIASRRDAVVVAREYFGAPTPRPKQAEASRNANAPEGAAPAPIAAPATPPAKVESLQASTVPASSDAALPKNSWAAALAKTRGNPGSESRFGPGAQGNRNQNRNASWNPNLAVGRGHPNGAARNSR